mmetsp:Transcript_42637/g.70580  ORF Transcript_42637/g.70580 Transcript_42637/m.70580 type:complete len:160 (-) Transcript_42637:481-960(-)
MSKYDDDGKASKYDDDEEIEGKDSALEIVELTRLQVSPEEGMISDGIELEVDFNLEKRVEEASWEIKMVVDSTHKRHIIVLGSTDAEDYDEGANNFYFSIPSIDVSGITAGTLTNAGLLVASLKGIVGDAQMEVIDVNMVVQVIEEEGAFRRTIYNPLE